MITKSRPSEVISFLTNQITFYEKISEKILIFTFFMRKKQFMNRFIHEENYVKSCFTRMNGAIDAIFH